MYLPGLLLTFSYLQMAHGPNDVYVRKDAVENLAADLKTSSPNLNLEVFRQFNIYRQGNIGYYLSENLRQFLFGGNVNPKDRGMIITITFDTPKTADEGNEDDEHLKHLVYLLRKAGFEQSQVSEDESYIKPRLAQFFNRKSATA